MIRPVSIVASAGLLCLLVSSANAQKPAPTGSVNPGAGTTGSPSLNGTTGTLGNKTTTLGNNGNGGLYDQQRPMFLSGSVMFDDGSPTNSDIRIERVCNGNTRLEGRTDNKGRFSVQIGSDTAIGIADADASSDSITRPGSTGSFGQSGIGNGSGRNSNNILGCELRAAYPGYVSETMDLSMRHSMDDPKLGTLVLHRLANVKGSTISLTTALAPKSAQKSFTKGTQLVEKGKLDEAEERFTSATADYPKFAAAWFELGQVQLKLNKPQEATKSFLSAVDADGRYVSPLDQLARLSAQQMKWQDAVRYSKAATDLNPVEFPSSFWYNALANYNLKNTGEAEKSARALVKLDSQHRYPEAETILAEFAANRGDLEEAAAHLRTYLTLAPNAKNADQLKRELATIEQARATQAKAAPDAVSH